MFEDVTLQTVLYCDPSDGNIFVCLVIATVFIKILIQVLTKVIFVILSSLLTEPTKAIIIEEKAETLKSQLSKDFLLKQYNDWLSLNKVVIPDVDTFYGSGCIGVNKWERESRPWLSWEEAIDAYVKNEDYRKQFTKFALEVTAKDLATYMQHGLSAAFAMLALYYHSKEPTLFLIFARWSVYLESGWEVLNTRNTVGKSGLTIFNIYGLTHHVSLWFTIPLIKDLLPSSVGPDIVLLWTICAGTVGPMSVMRFVKYTIDTTTKGGKVWQFVWQVALVSTFVISRGPVWFYFSCNILTTLWKDGASYLFLIAVLMFTMFSLYNVFGFVFAWRGLEKSLRKLNSGFTRRKSSTASIDTLVKRLNTTGPRTSVMKSISVAGIDFELDETEQWELEQEKKKGKKSRGLSLYEMISFRKMEHDMAPIEETSYWEVVRRSFVKGKQE